MLQISFVDWSVIFLYLISLLGLAYFLSRSQFNREDYYVGDRKMGAWPVAISIMATQCSTNSILGAPAFVAFAAGGGLIWLQYELSVPLAMIALIIFFIPVFRGLNLVTVYEYLERRFDLKTRLILSALFMFVRAFATAVTVYSIAIVIDLITGIGFTLSVMLLGVFTVVYDTMGGIKGVIYSDVMQMLILVGILILVALMLVQDTGGLHSLFSAFSSERRAAIDFSHHGFGDGHTFSFWPMLFGGFFLYVSYYGCDQSQTQRVLSTRSLGESNYALMLNGLLRFPLVALYCLVGVGIGVFAASQPEFLASLPQDNGSPNVNLAVPAFMIQSLPTGLVGLALVALFAAAMSSLDSVLNSLSASSMEDFVRRLSKRNFTGEQEIWISRGLTGFWGAITLVMAFYVGDIAPTVLEAINKIGSLVNGPVLGVFAMGIFSKQCTPLGAISGLIIGFCSNMMLWLVFPEISWLWWNVIGLAVTIVIGLLVSLNSKHSNSETFVTWRSQLVPQSKTLYRHKVQAWILAIYFSLLVAALCAFTFMYL